MLDVCVCFWFSSRRRHTRVELVNGVQTCARPIEQVSGASIADGNTFWGYEMHVGITEGASIPLLRMSDGRDDGAISADGRIAGCYIHGFFHSTAPRAAWLARLGAASNGMDHDQPIDDALDDLAQDQSGREHGVNSVTNALRICLHLL